MLPIKGVFSQDDFGRQVIFIIGNSKCCFALTQNRRIIKINYPLNVLDANLQKNQFLRINYHTLKL